MHARVADSVYDIMGLNTCFCLFGICQKNSAETGSDFRDSLTFGKRPPKHLAVASSRWSLTRIEPHGASFEKRSGHVYFMEDTVYCMQFLS